MFDKLLVLRALRPEFPEAIFFTTDFDEAFTIKTELPWTRNLLIASSFGPNLNEKIQLEIPAFRDTYQTSAFLAALTAIGDPANNWKTPEAFAARMVKKLQVPRIFEIDRNGNVLPLSGMRAPNPSPRNRNWKYKPCQENDRSCSATQLIANAGRIIEGRSVAAGGAQGSSTDRPCPGSDGMTSCGNIQPVVAKLFPAFEATSRKTLACGLAGAAILVLTFFFFRSMGAAAAVEVGLIFLSLAAGALACAGPQEGNAPSLELLRDAGGSLPALTPGPVGGRMRTSISAFALERPRRVLTESCCMPEAGSDCFQFRRTAAVCRRFP